MSTLHHFTVIVCHVHIHVYTHITACQNFIMETSSPLSLFAQSVPVATARLGEQVSAVEALEVESLEVEALEVEALEVEALEVESLEVESLEVEALEVEALEVEALEVESLEDCVFLRVDRLNLRMEPVAQVTLHRTDSPAVRQRGVYGAQQEGSGIKPASRPGASCACSPCVFMGFRRILQLPPTVHTHAGDSKWILGVNYSSVLWWTGDLCRVYPTSRPVGCDWTPAPLVTFEG
ncbi:unnamed protein product [Pleuronectes platessa]|uniref:Uncharacterized protein n=1 Tax=Pleuronectes platessa TaxID=8262 RepID=A0A9N7UXA2_PLEPL|nr:unnamed protein product [Pleuronectes platessa]